MSTDFQEGDLVEAVKGEERHIARIQKADGTPLLIIGSGGSGIQWFRENGFTLTLIERPMPKVELPAEPGIHTDKNGDIGQLHFRGYWTALGDDLGFGAAEKFAPFTRLESRANTAKAVIEWFADVTWGNRVERFPDVLKNARETFGVTND